MIDFILFLQKVPLILHHKLLLINSFNKIEAVIFPMQAMLSEDIPFKKIFTQICFAYDVSMSCRLHKLGEHLFKLLNKYGTDRSTNL